MSRVPITSEIPDFLTHFSWNKIEQLYSGAQLEQEGAIKYKLSHITLYLPTEPFGYNCTPVRYTALCYFYRVHMNYTGGRWRVYGLQVNCNFPTDRTLATQ